MINGASLGDKRVMQFASSKIKNISDILINVVIGEVVTSGRRDALEWLQSEYAEAKKVKRGLKSGNWINESQGQGGFELLDYLMTQNIPEDVKVKHIHYMGNNIRGMYELRCNPTLFIEKVELIWSSLTMEMKEILMTGANELNLIDYLLEKEQEGVDLIHIPRKDIETNAIEDYLKLSPLNTLKSLKCSGYYASNIVEMAAKSYFTKGKNTPLKLMGECPKWQSPYILPNLTS